MNMKHWKQVYESGKFQAYDYGSSKENSAHYGQPYPPQWNLGNIRMPMRLFAGDSDLLADVTDVGFLWDSLNPSMKAFYRTYHAGHCTFMWGNDVKPWMTDVFSMMN